MRKTDILCFQFGCKTKLYQNCSPNEMTLECMRKKMVRDQKFVQNYIKMKNISQNELL